MRFKFWSDTNMVNACTALEEQGVPFKADMVRNTVQLDGDYDEIRTLLRAEGGEEMKFGPRKRT